MTTAAAEVSTPTPPSDLRDRLAQLVVVRIGSNLPPIKRVHEDEDRVAAQLAECPVGGLLLFNGVWPDVRATLDRLQAASPTPLLVASDIERGAGQQVAGLTLFPHQRAFVDLPDAEDAIARFCGVTAREAQAAGIHATFGPVADANTNPRNPIIATRAFGDDPANAGRLAAAYVRAAEAAGLATCAKHFPGHGDTHQDSHDAMPRVDAPAEMLRQRELPPFRAAIGAGVSMLMTAHVEYPALDPSGKPATLSRPILVDLLRGELGFSGVVCTDSLLMAGVRDRFESEGDLALACLLAGVDLLLDIAEPAATVDALAKAAADGRLPAERIDEAFDRVWALKTKALQPGAASAPDPGPPTPQQSADAEAESLRVAGDAIRVAARPDAAGWPLDPAAGVTCVVLKPHHRPTDPAEQPLAEALRERFAEVAYFETGPEAAPTLADDIHRATPAGRPVVVAMIVKPAAWHAFGLTPDQDALVRALLETDLLETSPVVLACLGVENALDPYPSAGVRLVTHSDVPASQHALAERLVTG